MLWHVEVVLRESGKRKKSAKVSQTVSFVLLAWAVLLILATSHTLEVYCCTLVKRVSFPPTAPPHKKQVALACKL